MRRLQRQLIAALARHRAGDLDAACAGYRAVLAADPRQADALHLLGVARQQAGDAAEAVELIRAALNEKPSEPTFHNNLGNALQDLGDRDGAIAAYRAAIAARPDFAEAHNNLANALASAGHVEGAIDHFQRALAIAPDYVDALANLGDLLVDLDRPLEAVPHLRRAADLAPEQAELLCNLGRALRAAGDWCAAEQSYRDALVRSPQLAAAWVNLANVLRDSGRIDQAIETYRRSIELAPDLADAHANLAKALHELGELDGAAVEYERAIELAPDWSEPRHHYARLLLARGDWRRGWREYAHRPRPDRRGELPEWRAEPLAGRRLLVQSELPLGTRLLFARLLAELERYGGTVFVECEDRLAALYRRSFPAIHVVAIDATVDADLVIDIGSLPGLLLPSPAAVKQRDGYLVADRGRREHWRGRLARLGEGPKVGIAWRGGVSPEERRRRGTSLAAWRPIVSLDGMQFISLQHGECGDEIAAVRSLLGGRLHSFDDVDPIVDVEGFAALVAELDLIVSVDNTTVHLAGALGRPVWTLLHASADWRWLLEREESVWFANMRLIRQPPGERWEDSLTRVGATLASWRDAKHPSDSQAA